MIPAAFEYHRPSTLQDAVALLGRLGDEAKILAGGQSLIPLMKLRLASPRHVVDLNRISGLAYIAEHSGTLAIGALARESELEASELVRRRLPILADACRVIADPARAQPRHGRRQPRPRRPGQRSSRGDAGARGRGRGGRAAGTRGASRSPSSSRVLSRPRCGPDEILTEIHIPRPPPRSGRRLPEARAQGRRLRHGGRRRSQITLAERRCVRPRGHRPHQRRADADQGAPR